MENTQGRRALEAEGDDVSVALHAERLCSLNARERNDGLQMIEQLCRLTPEFVSVRCGLAGGGNFLTVEQTNHGRDAGLLRCQADHIGSIEIAGELNGLFMVDFL